MPLNHKRVPRQITAIRQIVFLFLLSSCSTVYADFGFPDTIKLPSQVQLSDGQSLTKEDLAEAEFVVDKNGKTATLRGTRFFRHLSYTPAAGEPALGYYNGSEARIFKAVTAALSSTGWQLIWANENKDAFSLKRNAGGADVWLRVAVDAPQGYVTLDLLQPITRIAAFTLPTPATKPEQFLDSEDIPYLLPPRGSISKSGQGRINDPLDISAPGSGQELRLAGTSTLTRAYQAPATLSKLQFVTDYRTALANAGWRIVYPDANRLSDAGEVIAQYQRNDRNIWVRLYYEYGANISLYATDIGAEDWDTKLKKDCKIALHGVYFDFNKSTLKPESAPVLNKALALIKAQAGMFELRGHTDSVGNDDANLKLSQARASSVRTWLTGAGIAEARLTAKGFGKTQAVADNNTDAGRAKNRRVELSLTECHAK